MSANSLKGRYSGRLLRNRYELGALQLREPVRELYRAQDRNSNQEVQVTILLPPLDGDDVAMGLIAADLATSRSCRHPNMIKILDSFSRQEQRRPGQLAFVVSEHSGGEHLSSIMERTGALETEDAVTLVVSLLEGLEALHQSGCVHGGVRPAAVFIPEGQGNPWHRPRLLDPSIFLYLFPSVFMLLDGSSSAPTGLAEMLVFAPPEQLMGDDPSPGMDVYSAGAVLFHALAGRPPIAAEDGLSMAELLDDLIHQNPELLFEFQPNLDDELVRAVSAALSRNPMDRPRSAAELREALLPWYRKPVAEEVDHEERAEPDLQMFPRAAEPPPPIAPPAPEAPLALRMPAPPAPLVEPPRRTVAMPLDQLEDGEESSGIPDDDHPTIKMALPPVEAEEEADLEAPPGQDEPQKNSTYIVPLDDLLAENEEAKEEQLPAEPPPRVEDKSQQTIALSLDELIAMEEEGESEPG